jgi:hypothetical protein
MGCCCQPQTKAYSNSIEKPLSAFQHNRSSTPDNNGASQSNGVDDGRRSRRNDNNLQSLRPTSMFSAHYSIDDHGQPIDDEEARIGKGITKFNMKPKDGIQFLQREQLIGTSATEVAHFLCSRRIFRGRSTLQSGLNKKKLGEYLGRYGRTEVECAFHRDVLVAFMKHTAVNGVDVDVALRRCLETFLLAGEAAVIDRVIQGFADWYHTSNPGTFRHADTAHVLAFGIIMLNTDAHNKQVKKKMTEIQFLQIMKGIDQGSDLNATMLKNVYHRTTTEAFALDQHEHGVVTFFNAHREGWLWKCGSKSRKRWRKRWFLINNHCLYYFKLKPDVGLDSTATCKCVIPLEDLRVQLKDNGKFSIYASREGSTLKTAKRSNQGMLIQGNHSKMTFRAESSEIAKLWVDDILSEMAPNPFLLHLQRLGVEQQEENQPPDEGNNSVEKPQHVHPSAIDSAMTGTKRKDEDYMRDDGQLVTDSEMETDDENDFGSGNRDLIDFGEDDDSASSGGDDLSSNSDEEDSNSTKERDEEIILQVEEREEKANEIQETVTVTEVIEDKDFVGIEQVEEKVAQEVDVIKVHVQDEEVNTEVANLTSIDKQIEMKSSSLRDIEDGERIGRSPTISMSDEKTFLSLGKSNSSL